MGAIFLNTTHPSQVLQQIWPNAATSQQNMPMIFSWVHSNMIGPTSSSKFCQMPLFCVTKLTRHERIYTCTCLFYMHRYTKKKISWIVCRLSWNIFMPCWAQFNSCSYWPARRLSEGCLFLGVYLIVHTSGAYLVWQICLGAFVQQNTTNVGVTFLRC